MAAKKIIRSSAKGFYAIITVVIRLVLFDIDGTLIRTGGAGVKAFEQTMAAEFGVPHATRDISFGGRTDTSLVRELFLKHGIEPSPQNFRRFFDSYPFRLAQLLCDLQGAACAGVFEFLKALQDLPQPPVLGLLTGNVRLGAEIKLRHYGMWDWFVTGGFGDDHENRNEIARIAFSRGQELLGKGLQGREVLVIGDTPHDIACARAIGGRALAVATGACELEHLAEHAPCWAVPHLGAVEARAICHATH